MPHVVGLILLGAGLYAGYRAAKRMAARMTEGLEGAEVRPAAVVEKDLGALEYDPASGVYRPRR